MSIPLARICILGGAIGFTPHLLHPAETPASEEEILLERADKLPPSPVEVRRKRLTWPLPGEFGQGVRVWNNYQQPSDSYVHAGIDILGNAGTEVRAVEAGWVATVATNYPDWTTHHFFVVTPVKGGDVGWCYAHVDPSTYTFEVGDRVKRGALLGNLVDFKLGERDGADHLHLEYVRYETRTDGTVETHDLVDPMLFFDYADDQPPVLEEEIRFVHDGTLEPFTEMDGERVVLSGKVDVIAGLSDNAFEGMACNWGVPVVTLEIEGQGAEAYRKLVLDQRGPIPEPRASSALYVPFSDGRDWLEEGRHPWPTVYFLIVTNTDGDGVIEATDREHTWDTAARTDKGKPRFPDGEYVVTVRAWDLARNLSTRTARVRVRNH